MTYAYDTRAEFILAGFRVERRDGAFVFIATQPDAAGNFDYQTFPSPEAMVVWLAAGISEIQTAEFIADITLKRLSAQPK